MFLVNPIHHWQIILALTALQLIIILGWGWLLKAFVRKRYALSSPSYQLFERQDYSPHSSYDVPKYPQYSLVLVKFNRDRTVHSETFYTNLGDWVYFEYENEQKIKSKAIMISSLFLIGFCVVGVSAIWAFNVLNIAHVFLKMNEDFLIIFLKVAKEVCGISFWSSGITLLSKPSFEN